jgi:hypothetical protein
MVIVNAFENPQHGIVENDTGFVQVTGIPTTDLDHLGIAIFVQLLLALHVVISAPFDDYFQWIGQQNWLG